MTMANYDDEVEPVTRLKTAIDIAELGSLNSQGLEFEVEKENEGQEEETDIQTFNKTEVVSNICLISDDEEEDDDSKHLTELEKLWKRFSHIKDNDITPAQDGGVLKQMKNPGTGDIIPYEALVTVHYNAYTDVGQPPYDSTCLRRDPTKMRLTDVELGELMRTLKKHDQPTKKQLPLESSHFGHALHGLGSIEDAITSLRAARNIDPSNAAVSSALKSVAKSLKEYHHFERSMCQRMFSNANSDSEPGEEPKEELEVLGENEYGPCSDAFKKLVQEKLKEFQDSTMTEMPFPSIHMTESEIECILKTAVTLGMDVKQRGTGSSVRYEVYKKSAKLE